WLHLGNPWEIRRPEVQVHVKLGGHTEHYHDSDGRLCVRWIPHRIVKGVPSDTPISGYKVNTCNTLRLWKAEACEGFDFSAFNKGDYYGAVDEKVASENLTKVLYPNDEPIAGKRLRLEQQYFFVSCSLQNIVYLHSRFSDSFDNFQDVWAVQLNDTHPAVAIPELMRLLVDEHLMEWEKAWDIVQKTMAYTNHTLLSEALETWPLNLFADVLPRHMEIIYEINDRFLNQVRSRYPGDDGRLFRMSLIDETGEKYVRMANLACVGSHAVNGVAALHTKLLKQTVLRDFYEMTPEKFNNKTNGVTPRRFMVLSNPGLSKLITGRIGDAWIKDLSALRRIEGFADDGEFQDEWRRVKRQAKQRLAGLIQEKTGISVNVDSLFDIHVKRIHEYKRQHLKVLHIITLYNRLKNNPEAEIAPRTFIFGGKAAPGYFMAKLIIRLINSVSDVVNQDPDIRDRLKVVFLPDFSVKVGQRVYPGADLSEQISTAGKEASGTGNMKFSMNGALTVGTLDGANIEIREEVGPENFFLFGLTADQVIELKSSGYNPMERYQSNPQLRDAIDRIASGFFSKGNANLFKPLIDRLLYHDDYLLFADYPSYIDCQEKIGQTFKNQEKWTRMSILNVARIGKFSSDRSIMEYCNEIWNVKPIPIYLDDPVHTEVKKKTKKT
ncbi:MAG TPA: glycogen/starch/alpha-glucan phosphorylase, partial [Desulfobacterales bacterium]|nr:glycogen/starch/alpha-glucan phosphorylase [Desulfobacterales bacterium]